MPRHRNLNLKKFVESIPEKLLREYFRKRLRKRISLKSFDYDSIKEFIDTVENGQVACVACNRAKAAA